ncbi:hypothetical protein CROQUDRAFT_655967 [Cronartium quercuum f. sp. fusiforme G11]|uniref:3-beta hydroxysteroid dehydrogenase/isomerase domain-containing protein n=1 Tax=Cronartium quercuum f. sp. fusiforme G11 TaxID=708437 RepID=A0A9P6NIH0_9BASI|nr:hypothetical protein CROQUDRAFT_655967 [Cronartium quercuum f. sp. fusiforme G11]
MPAITPSSHVLVTGASGYIAAWTCQVLLERDFKVRGTVRSKEKGDYLSDLFKKFGDKWSYVIVKDVEDPNGFDDAVKGVDGVAHICSPFHMNMTDPYKDLINPAVNGTESILKSANGPNGKSVKRIVITSSFASVVNPTDDLSHVFTEKDWNEHSPKVVNEKGKDAPPHEAYRASKVLAEKAAWSFMDKNKPAFDLVTICPPYVLGPVIHQVKDAKSLNTSVNFFYDYLAGKSDPETAKNPMGSMVDVRDVAIAHVQSLVIEKAGGNRYAVSKQRYTWQDTLDIVQDKEHGKLWPDAIKGTPGSGKLVKQNLFDASKSIKDLGLNYHSLEETVLDMSSSLKDLSKTW